MEKIKNMWSNLKPTFKIFIVIAVGILIYALVNNIFN
tara:strand:- start:6180 stop:6290 length:111 start_codon:yes stop_codon:yes gene_type:complete